MAVYDCCKIKHLDKHTSLNNHSVYFKFHNVLSWSPTSCAEQTSQSKVKRTVVQAWW